MNEQAKWTGKDSEKLPNHYNEKDANDTSQLQATESSSGSVTPVSETKTERSKKSACDRMSEPESTRHSTSNPSKPDLNHKHKKEDDEVDSLDLSLSKLKLDTDDQEKTSPPKLGTGILEFVKIDPSFTTPKLRAIIQDNVNGSFKLNWISKDKTRVNFESIDDAASILSLMKSSTQVKVTPYTPPEENPQAEKKMPPRGPSVSRLTGKPRPATSDAVARRLIVGHLGLKTKSNGEA